MPPTKLSVLLGLMKAGEWRGALSLAAKFHDLGEQKQAITRAHDALQNPDFYRQIKKDPDVLLAQGVEALKERYLNEERNI